MTVKQRCKAFAQLTTRPPTVDPQIVSRFLAHGVIGVLGRWLDDVHSPLSDDQVVEQLMNCFPSWLTAAPSTPTASTHEQPHIYEKSHEERDNKNANI